MTQSINEVHCIFIRNIHFLCLFNRQVYLRITLWFP